MNGLPLILHVLLSQLVAVAAIALVLAVVIHVVWRWRTSTHPEPMCRRCGYPVRGLPSNLCPECGGELDGTGTLKPYLTRPFPPFINAILWTAILPGPVLLLTFAVHEYVPRENTRTATFTIRAHEGLPEALRLGVKATCSNRSERPITDVTIHPEGDSSPGKDLKVVLPEFLYSYEAMPKDQRRSRLDENATAAWLQTLGVDPAEAGKQSKYVMKTLDALDQQFTADPRGSLSFPRDPRFAGYPISFNNALREPRWYLWLAAAVWLFIWLCGTYLLLRSRHTHQSRSQVQQRPDVFVPSPRES